ncbi:MAG: hypothetical protein ABIZ07_13765 [Dermatophilaceae bacterium]
MTEMYRRNATITIWAHRPDRIDGHHARNGCWASAQGKMSA